MPMQISTRHEYAVEPIEVVTMMADETWLAEVARHAGAESWEVSAAEGRSQVHAQVPAPRRAKTFTGPYLKIHLTITWHEPEPDGSYRGDIEVALDGLPASMHGTGVATAAEVAGRSGTAVSYDADFVINIPVLGRNLEEAAAPHVLRIINTQQDVGREWLANRPA